MVEVDHVDHEALVAVPLLSAEIVGECRFIRLPDQPGTAEVGGWRTRPRAGWRRSDPRSRASGAPRAGRWTGTRVRAKPSSGALPAVSPATRM
jgi:hypothetical protein